MSRRKETKFSGITRRKGLKLRRWLIKELIARNIEKLNGKKLSQCKNNELELEYFKIVGVLPSKIFKIEEKASEKKRRMEMEEDGFIYLIGNLKYGFVKIGFSKTPEKRIKAIQTGCPFPLAILKTYKGSIGKEYLLHKKYHRYRTFGEWFKIQGSLQKVIEDVVLSESAEKSSL